MVVQSIIFFSKEHGVLINIGLLNEVAVNIAAITLVAVVLCIWYDNKYGTGKDLKVKFKPKRK